jgi:hypothetical protein
MPSFSQQFSFGGYALHFLGLTSHLGIGFDDGGDII